MDGILNLSKTLINDYNKFVWQNISNNFHTVVERCCWSEIMSYVGCPIRPQNVCGVHENEKLGFDVKFLRAMVWLQEFLSMSIFIRTVILVGT